MPPIGKITARHGLLISARFQAESEWKSQIFSAMFKNADREGDACVDVISTQHLKDECSAVPPGLSGSVAPSIVTVGTFTMGFCARRSSSDCNAGSPASRPNTLR